MKCPCKECISFAICVNINGSGCELTDQYIGTGSKDFIKRVKEVRTCLKRDYYFVSNGETKFYLNRLEGTHDFG